MARWTEPGGSWAAGVVAAVGPRGTEGGGAGRRPGARRGCGSGDSCWAGRAGAGGSSRPGCSGGAVGLGSGGRLVGPQQQLGGSGAGPGARSRGQRLSCTRRVRLHQASSSCRAWISFRRAWLSFSSDSCCWCSASALSVCFCRLRCAAARFFCLLFSCCCCSRGSCGAEAGAQGCHPHLGQQSPKPSLSRAPRRVTSSQKSAGRCPGRSSTVVGMPASPTCPAADTQAGRPRWAAGRQAGLTSHPLASPAICVALGRSSRARGPGSAFLEVREQRPRWPERSAGCAGASGSQGASCLASGPRALLTDVTSMS